MPLGLVEPQSEAERQELEQDSEIVLKAMINAAKADGQIDRGEIQRIVGKLRETGMAEEAQEYVMTEMQKPMDTPALVAAAKALRRALPFFIDKGGHPQPSKIFLGPMGGRLFG